MLTQLEGHVVGEHAQEHVGADARFQVVVDGTDQDLGGLHLAKGPLGDFQLLVGPHHRPGPELFAPAGGAEHVEAVAPPLLRSRPPSARRRRRRLRSQAGSAWPSCIC